MILYATLALCAAVTGVVVYRYDLYDREPFWLLGLCAALAAGAMSAAGRLESLAFQTWPPHGNASMALLAAVVEELAKLGVVAGIALVDRRHFNDPLDGLVYGSLAGLGAAVEESVAFLRSASHAPAVLPGSEVVRIAGHLVMGGLGAFGLGALRLSRPRAWAWVLTGWAAAVTLHFLWDWNSLRAITNRRALEALPAVGLMLGGLVVWRRLVTIGLGWSKAVFAAAPGEEARLVDRVKGNAA
jgi:RsiW-degrading membrane proteinase PrsW (M82 family)